jgi:hypothetical protein
MRGQRRTHHLFPPSLTPTAAARQVMNFKQAVQKGWITWHAWPFNSELELADPLSLQVGHRDATRALRTPIPPPPRPASRSG